MPTSSTMKVNLQFNTDETAGKSIENAKKKGIDLEKTHQKATSNVLRGIRKVRTAQGEIKHGYDQLKGSAKDAGNTMRTTARRVADAFRKNKKENQERHQSFMRELQQRIQAMRRESAAFGQMTDKNAKAWRNQMNVLRTQWKGWLEAKGVTPRVGRHFRGLMQNEYRQLGINLAEKAVGQGTMSLEGRDFHVGKLPLQYVPPQKKKARGGLFTPLENQDQYVRMAKKSAKWLGKMIAKIGKLGAAHTISAAKAVRARARVNNQYNKEMSLIEKLAAKRKHLDEKLKGFIRSKIKPRDKAMVADEFERKAIDLAKKNAAGRRRITEETKRNIQAITRKATADGAENMSLREKLAMMRKVAAERRRMKRELRKHTAETRENANALVNQANKAGVSAEAMKRLRTALRGTGVAPAKGTPKDEEFERKAATLGAKSRSERKKIRDQVRQNIEAIKAKAKADAGENMSMKDKLKMLVAIQKERQRGARELRKHTADTRQNANALMGLAEKAKASGAALRRMRTALGTAAGGVRGAVAKTGIAGPGAARDADYEQKAKNVTKKYMSDREKIIDQTRRNIQVIKKKMQADAGETMSMRQKNEMRKRIAATSERMREKLLALSKATYGNAKALLQQAKAADVSNRSLRRMRRTMSGGPGMIPPPPLRFMGGAGAGGGAGGSGGGRGGGGGGYRPTGGAFAYPAGAAGAGFKKLGRSIMRIVGPIGAGITAFALLRRGIQELEKAAVAFDSAMGQVHTLLPITNFELGNLAEELRNMSLSMPLRPSELAGGLYQVISSGFTDPKGAKQVMSAASQLAVAGRFDPFSAVDALTTVMNAFNVEAKEAEKVTDIFFKTVERGKLTLKDMANQVGTVATTAARAGITIEELGSFIAGLTAAGVKAPEATIALNQLLRDIRSPKPSTRDWAIRYEIDWNQEGVRRIGLAGILKQVQAAQERFPDRAILAEGIENVRVERAAGTGLRRLPYIIETLEQMEGVAGATDRAYRKVTRTLEAQAKMVENEMLVAWEKFGRWWREFKTWAFKTFIVPDTKDGEYDARRTAAILGMDTSAYDDQQAVRAASAVIRRDLKSAFEDLDLLREMIQEGLGIPAELLKEINALMPKKDFRTLGLKGLIEYLGNVQLAMDKIQPFMTEHFERIVGQSSLADQQTQIEIARKYLTNNIGDPSELAGAIGQALGWVQKGLAWWIRNQTGFTIKPGLWETALAPGLFHNELMERILVQREAAVRLQGQDMPTVEEEEEELPEPYVGYVRFGRAQPVEFSEWMLAMATLAKEIDTLAATHRGTLKGTPEETEAYAEVMAAAFMLKELEKEGEAVLRAMAERGEVTREMPDGTIQVMTPEEVEQWYRKRRRLNFAAEGVDPLEIDRLPARIVEGMGKVQVLSGGWTDPAGRFGPSGADFAVGGRPISVTTDMFLEKTLGEALSKLATHRGQAFDFMGRLKDAGLEHIGEDADIVTGDAATLQLQSAVNESRRNLQLSYMEAAREYQQAMDVVESQLGGIQQERAMHQMDAMLQRLEITEGELLKYLEFDPEMSRRAVSFSTVLQYEDELGIERTAAEHYERYLQLLNTYMQKLDAEKDAETLADTLPESEKFRENLADARRESENTLFQLQQMYPLFQKMNQEGQEPDLFHALLRSQVPLTVNLWHDLRDNTAEFREDLDDANDSVEDAIDKWTEWANVIQKLARALLKLMDGLGIVDADTRRAVQGVVDLAAAMIDARAIIAEKRAANEDIGAIDVIPSIAAGIAAVASIIGSLFRGDGSQEEREKLLREQNEEMRRLRTALDEMRKSVIQARGVSDVEKDIKTVTDEFRVEWKKGFPHWLSQRWDDLTDEQKSALERLAQMQGVSIDDLTQEIDGVTWVLGDRVRMLLESIEDMDFGVFAEDLKGQMDAMKYVFKTLGDDALTASEKLDKFVETLAEFSPTASQALRKALDKDPAEAKKLMESWAQILAAGGDPLKELLDRFGITAEELQAVIDTGMGLLGAEATSKNVQIGRSITEIQAVEVIAWLEDIAITLHQIRDSIVSDAVGAAADVGAGLGNASMGTDVSNGVASFNVNIGDISIGMEQNEATFQWFWERLGEEVYRTGRWPGASGGFNG